MKLQIKRLIFSLTIFTCSVFLWSCEQPKATVTDLSKPLSTSPTPTPTPPQAVDPKRTDLNRVVVGSNAPDFSLEDMNKKTVHLSDFRGKQYVVLVFYRGFF